MLSILSSEERVSVSDYDKIHQKNNHHLIDVRSKIEFEMCHLPNSINIPFGDIEKNLHQDKIQKLNVEDASSGIPLKTTHLLTALLFWNVFCF